MERKSYLESEMSQSLECPRCHSTSNVRRGGWQSRSCPVCGSPMILGAAPAEALVRRYLHGDRLTQLSAPSVERRE